MSEKTILNKKQIILDFTDTARWENRDETVEHRGVCYESDDSDVMVWFDVEDWRDMGRPQEITVTIEPGDRLNDATE